MAPERPISPEHPDNLSSDEQHAELCSWMLGRNVEELSNELDRSNGELVTRFLLLEAVESQGAAHVLTKFYGDLGCLDERARSQPGLELLGDLPPGNLEPVAEVRLHPADRPYDLLGESNYFPEDLGESPHVYLWATPRSEDVEAPSQL